MKTLKVTITGIMIVVLLAIVMLMSSCSTPNSNIQIARKQEQLVLESNAQVGWPSITNFQEKKTLKWILELRDQEDLVCYAYIVSQMDGKLIYLGKCIGYGIPYSTQYTNPEVKVFGNGNSHVLPQADPNGLFMPDGMSATWLLMIDPKTNEPRPVYLEPQIIVSPFKLN